VLGGRGHAVFVSTVNPPSVLGAYASLVQGVPTTREPRPGCWTVAAVH